MVDEIKKLRKLQRRIGYRFKDPELFLRSMTHPSFCRQETHLSGHNQRLEFLGDAVLSTILADRLFHLLPAEREGYFESMPFRPLARLEPGRSFT